MPQVAHVDVGGAQPVELSDGLAAGCYVAQVVAPLAAIGDAVLLYATADAAPADPADWFRASHGDYFTFTVGTALPATWAQASAAELTIPVALALVPS